MLVLSRKVGEEIKIDGHVKVTVLSIEGKRIQLGIEAPRHVSVLRGELDTKLDLPIDFESTEAHVPTNRLLAGGYLEG